MKQLSGLTIRLLLILVFAIGCENDSRENEKTLVSTAREWYGQQPVGSNSITFGRKPGEKIVPRWEYAQQHLIDGKKVLVIPIIDDKCSYNDKSFTFNKKLILKVSNSGKIISGSCLLFIARNYDVKLNEKELLNDLIQENRVTNKVVTIIEYDLGGNVLNTKILGIQKGLSRTLNQRKKQSLSSNRGSSNCTDWYWVTTWSDGSKTEQYVYTTCDDSDNYIDNGNGGSGGPTSSEDQARNSLCGSYSFSTTGDGITAEILGLGARAQHSGTGRIVNAIMNVMCITFGSSSGIGNSTKGSDVFNESWNITIEKAQEWLNQQAETPSSTALTGIILSNLRFYLSFNSNGSYALSNGPCSKIVPSSQARYCK